MLGAFRSRNARRRLKARPLYCIVPARARNAAPALRQAIRAGTPACDAASDSIIARRRRGRPAPGGDDLDNEKAAAAFRELLDLTEHLRSPEGCAWDRAQNVDTLRPHLVEEFHETLEALDDGDDSRLRDELGDLLFIVVFISSITADEGRFGIADVLSGIDGKLRRRHPHVFGDASASTPDQVRATWETVKMSEGSHSERESLLDGLPREMPALLTARRLQEKAAAVGFDWDDLSDVVEKVLEELAELRSEIDKGDARGHLDELGDLLFAVVNLARSLSVDPDAALRKANLKFRRRFLAIERAFEGRDLRDVGLDEMDRVWEKAKEDESES
ncbi:MAG: nucleoside triphosphate pyrophosphohydrolase [Candidatus Eisenbacteria bacterium]|nr:nucleoside triphosphate pyrophosphohydrolase [Candidatus Eisenbacteria bacterium]